MVSPFNPVSNFPAESLHNIVKLSSISSYTMPASYLVTGATGQQGGATARALLSAGATVHALVRNPSSPAAQALQEDGAVLFKGDFDDVPAIRAATAGVSGVSARPSPSAADPRPSRS